VFCNAAGDRLDPSALRRRYLAAGDSAALPPLRFHDLRHTAGTLLTRVLDPVTVKDVSATQTSRRRCDICTRYAPRGSPMPQPVRSRLKRQRSPPKRTTLSCEPRFAPEERRLLLASVW
jgi:integrase